MNIDAALKLRDKYRPLLIGKPIHGKEDGWNIVDVIVSDVKNIGFIANDMFQLDITNEQALGKYNIPTDNYEVYVISHQWPWGSGNVLTSNIEAYLVKHPI